MTEDPTPSLEDGKLLNVVSSSAQQKDNHCELAVPLKRPFDSLPDRCPVAFKHLPSLMRKRLGKETLKHS